MPERLDVLLVARGFFETRTQARAAILAGEVSVDGRLADKPGTQVARPPCSTSPRGRRFVSSGGDKLDHAMEALGVSVEGEDACDLGSSTGGFVDRLLQGGAARVIAVDVGYGQLDYAPARRRARDRPRAHQRALSHRRSSALRAVVRHRRPLVHLPDGRPGPRARIPAPRLPRPRAREAAVRGRSRASRQGGRGA